MGATGTAGPALISCSGWPELPGPATGQARQAQHAGQACQDAEDVRALSHDALPRDRSSMAHAEALQPGQGLRGIKRSPAGRVSTVRRSPCGKRNRTRQSPRTSWSARDLRAHAEIRHGSRARSKLPSLSACQRQLTRMAPAPTFATPRPHIALEGGQGFHSRHSAGPYRTHNVHGSRAGCARRTELRFLQRHAVEQPGINTVLTRSERRRQGGAADADAADAALALPGTMDGGAGRGRLKFGDDRIDAQRPTGHGGVIHLTGQPGLQAPHLIRPDMATIADAGPAPAATAPASRAAARNQQAAALCQLRRMAGRAGWAIMAVPVLYAQRLLAGRGRGWADGD